MGPHDLRERWKLTGINGPGPARVAVAAGLLCLLVHLRSLWCGFIDIDDSGYVVNNLFIRRLDWDLITAAFTESRGSFRIPLTLLSFALDYRLWGLNPLGFHLTNTLLHAANSGLVVLIADRLLRQRFAGVPAASRRKLLYPGVLLLAGLLFGLHPLRVESVAWVSERKDVLNGLFSFGSILTYLTYAHKRKRGEPAVREYFIALVLFLLSLLAKSISVVIPALLLVADWYPLGRFRAERIWRLLAEKAPYLFFSVAAAAVTVSTVAQDGNLVSYREFPLAQRLLVAGNALFEYVRLTVYPVGIVPLYVIHRPIPAAYAVKGAVVVAAAVGIFAVRRRRWIPAAALGFVIPLLPVLSLFQNGVQALAPRFTYLSSVAPSITAAALIGLSCGKAAAAGRRRLLQGGMLLVAALLVCWTVISVRLIETWENAGTRWTRQIELEPLGRAYRDRGFYYHQNGSLEAAYADYTAAIGIARERGWQPLYNLFAFRGALLADLGREREAVEDFSAAISLFPHPSYYQGRGRALEKLGRDAEAREDFGGGGPAPPALDWF